MKNIILGICIGILFSLAVFVPIIRQYTIESYKAVGFNDGQISTLSDVAKVIEREFGVYDGKSEYKTLFSVKTTDIIIVNQASEKSLKIIP